jgi:hypothetical protein
VTPFSPVVDGAAREVSLAVGHNRGESRLFLFFAGQLGKVFDEAAS